MERMDLAEQLRKSHLESVFKTPLVVMGAVMENSGKIVMVKEGKGYDEGKWNLPTGRQDPGEVPLETCIREIGEEAGVVFRPLSFLGIYSSVRQDLATEKVLPHVLRLMWRGTYEGKLVSGKDILAVELYAPEEIINLENLRSQDIPQIIRDYQAGVSYPLEIVRHIITT